MCAGIPGPRVPFAPQRVELIDEVCYDFPELTFVMRHGAEPWTELAVKLMLKWPNLYYSTSAFAPKHYDRDIIDYANTRGADKIIYAGYFPAGLTYDRIWNDMPNVPLQGRGLAQVPPRQRPQGPAPRLITGRRPVAATGGGSAEDQPAVQGSPASRLASTTSSEPLMATVTSSASSYVSR